MISKPARGNLSDAVGVVDRTQIKVGVTGPEFNPEVEVPPGIPSWLASLNDVNALGDQCRAVLGPIPEIHCADGHLLAVSADGSDVQPAVNNGAPSLRPLFSITLNRCDNPAYLPWLIGLNLGLKESLAKGCIPNERVGVYQRGPVSWAFTCGYFDSVHDPVIEGYHIVSVIGSNARTGESCFFTHFQGVTDGKALVPPGGRGPKDPARKEAAKFWSPPIYNTCLRCHSSHLPWSVTPHLNQSSLGGDGSMDLAPLVESADTKVLKARAGSFRVIGTVHNQLWEYPQNIVPKLANGQDDRTCTRCHGLPSTLEFVEFAKKSVTDYPWMTPKRTAVRAWMPPDAHHEKIYQEAVDRLEKAFKDKSVPQRREEIIARCPQPDALSPNDVHWQQNEKHLQVRWKYRNSYGGVALRDDVRFRLSIVAKDGTACDIDDIAPDALGSNDWHFNVRDEDEGKTYRLTPYRYCFDREDRRYAEPTEIPTR